MYGWMGRAGDMRGKAGSSPTEALCAIGIGACEEWDKRDEQRDDGRGRGDAARWAMARAAGGLRCR